VEAIMTPEQIEAALLDETSGLRDRAGRAVLNFTVAMLAVANHETSAHPLRLVGTGTLVVHRDVHYILTAAHVWEAIQQRGTMLGLTLAEGVEHEFLIPNNNIVASGPPYDAASVDWGPDLVFLRIPPERLGTIRAYKVFYNLSIDRPGGPLEAIGAYVVMGTPGELGEHWPRFAMLQVNAFFLERNPRQNRRGEFDYLEFTVDLTFPGVPRTFGGVSGGGLWQVYFYWDKTTKKIETIERLKGVAYVETPIVNDHRNIRFHGFESIRAARPQVPEPRG
jgi:hypothetical protein